MRHLLCPGGSGQGGAELPLSDAHRSHSSFDCTCLKSVNSRIYEALILGFAKRPLSTYSVEKLGFEQIQENINRYNEFNIF